MTDYPKALSGMTLRDYFAAKAMQSLILNEESTFELDAIAAYKAADAMLAARNTPPKNAP